MSSSEWKEIELESAIDFNPKESIKKGEVVKKVSMDKLDVFNRKISGYEKCVFSGGTKFRNGDTLLARITPCLENGKTAQVSILDENEIGFGSTEFIVLREKSGITDNNFIYYLAISPEFRSIAIKSMTGTSGRQRVQSDVLQKSKILLPSLDEQKAIANILSSLDEKIELNNQMNKTLEEMAQALFKRWFVDFEFPNEEGEPYKSSGGEMVDSELGMIPKGWKVGSLEDICKYSREKVDVAEITLENYISTENMLQNKKGVTIATNIPSTGKVTRYRQGNVLVSNIRPYFKKIYFSNNEGGCSNDVLCFVTKEEYQRVFLYLTLLEDKFFEYMMKGAKGTKMPRGDKQQIMRYPIVVPITSVFKNFQLMLTSNIQMINKIKEENVILMQLRDTLLPKLMSGEIRVKDLQI